MESALPSLRTVQRIIHSQYHHLSERQFQFDELVRQLTKYNSRFVVAISEDATRLIDRVEYDKETDRNLRIFEKIAGISESLKESRNIRGNLGIL